jgi:hypothetical protein
MELTLKNFGVLLGLFLGSQAWACATCGLAQGFTPQMLFISLGFVVLPVCFVLYIAYRLKASRKNSTRN